MGNEVHVYYPVDKSSADRKKYEDAFWLPDGERTLKGLLKVNIPYFSHEFIPTIFHQQLKKVKLGVYDGAPVSLDFRKKPIAPIVFSHGLGAAAFFYSRILKDLASHGYIVFGINY